MSQFYIIETSGLPIFEQLQLEEALLRADQSNWCLINHGSPDAIVLGISGKIEELVDQERQRAKAIPLIRRFSGGGTVYIDKETIFVTFIVNETTPSPKKVMAWTEELYKPFFSPHPFSLQEHDYAMGEKKFGGNAQYMQKGRWLHHTSFLWSYEKEKMDLLKLPPKRPQYRKNRSHEEFLTTLKQFYKNKEQFIKELSSYLEESLSATKLPIEKACTIKARPHRTATIFY